jgi:hypothetical protein
MRTHSRPFAFDGFKHSRTSPFRLALRSLLGGILNHRLTREEDQHNREHALLWLLLSPRGAVVHGGGGAPDASREHRIPKVKKVLKGGRNALKFPQNGPHNNQIEKSHWPTRKRERRMQRLKSPSHAQRFLAAYGPIAQHFRPRRHLLTASAYHQEMRQCFQMWRETTSTARAVYGTSAMLLYYLYTL